jgi:hypothetical protein
MAISESPKGVIRGLKRGIKGLERNLKAFGLRLLGVALPGKWRAPE